MLTPRGYWFVIITGLLVFVGVVAVPTWSPTPAVVALTLAVWLTWEWIQFRRQLIGAIGRLRVDRLLLQNQRPLPLVWAGVPFQMRVRIRYDNGPPVPYVVVEDLLPVGLEVISGRSQRHAALQPGLPLELEYTLKSPTLGLLRFEGIEVRVINVHGLFYHRVFLREGTEYWVLPPLTDDEGRQRANKRFNLLPPPGIHRHRRPGTGSELLDLRDYRPGDPPKMIAWKPSARRDRLITKEYESDVPVRCVLFLDASAGVRFGPVGQTPLVRLATLASGVAQAAAANRDLIGLTVFDEQHVRLLSPGRTRTHLIQILQRLAEAASRLPDHSHARFDDLFRRANALASKVYPDLMAPEINTMPLGRYWLPLLDTRWGWLVLLAIATTPMLLIQKEWLRWTASVALALRPEYDSGFARFTAFVLLWLMAALAPALAGLLVWGLYSMRGWLQPRRQQLAQRKRLAALLALRAGTGPAGVEHLLHNEAAFIRAMGRFLTEHRASSPFSASRSSPPFDTFESSQVTVLAQALVRCLSQARDNELYVVLADLVELQHALKPFLHAVRLARSKHHQVLVIVPWPTELTSSGPAAQSPSIGTQKTAKERSRHHKRWPLISRLLGGRRKLKQPVDPELYSQVLGIYGDYYAQAYHDLRRDLVRAGASVLRVDATDSVQVVLDRLDRLRGLRMRR